MQAFTADLGLAFQSGEDELGKLLVIFFRPINENTLDELSQQILMMEWNVRSSIL